MTVTSGIVHKDTKKAERYQLFEEIFVPASFFKNCPRHFITIAYFFVPLPVI